MKLSMTLVFLLALIGCSQSQPPGASNASEAAKPLEASKPETLVEGGYDEKEMDAAIARSERGRYALSRNWKTQLESIMR